MGHPLDGRLVEACKRTGSCIFFKKKKKTSSYSGECVCTRVLEGARKGRGLVFILYLSTLLSC